MPNLPEHKNLSEFLFAEGMESVHKYKDAPSQWLGGSHRVVRHGPASHMKVAKRFKGRGEIDFRKALASVQHDLQDGVLSTWLLVIAIGVGIGFTIWGIIKLFEKLKYQCPRCKYLSTRKISSNSWFCPRCGYTFIFQK